MQGADGGRETGRMVDHGGGMHQRWTLEPESEPLGPELKSKLYFNVLGRDQNSDQHGPSRSPCSVDHDDIRRRQRWEQIKPSNLARDPLPDTAPASLRLWT